MENEIFLVAKDPENECRDLIFHRDGTLRIKVVCLNENQYVLKPDEIQFYALNNGEELLFETINYNYEEPGLIIEAIRWYAKYIGNPEMEIESELH
ncbi:hypothetical protein [Daejeonella oryzae]|uniref:hypothetical protein n=1 Tax=Daejeonella oryzae TaxID=1122943 RepID=UPI0004223387|nr:hypothetical protein [Daejeonella oryzae]